MSIAINLPLSVIVIAHQQNEKLRACLHSVKWANEVIVFYTGSDQISLPDVHVIASPQHITDFSAVRNEAMHHATHDWVFFVDSDEVVDENSVATLPHLLQSDAVGFRVQRKDIFLGKTLRWGEVGNVQIVRLFRKTAGHYVRAVHEVVELNGTIEASPIVLYHAAHDSLSSFLDKVIVYSQLEADLRKKKHVHTSIFELFAWPMGKFIVNYVVKLGALDGWRGLTYATMMSLHSFAVRALLYEDQHHSH